MNTEQLAVLAAQVHARVLAWPVGEGLQWYRPDMLYWLPVSQSEADPPVAEFGRQYGCPELLVSVATGVHDRHLVHRLVIRTLGLHWYEYCGRLGSPDPAVRRTLADALAAAVPGIVAELTKEA